MEQLFLQWIKDPTGAAYELFNRSIFYILVAIASSVAAYFWTKIKFRARNVWHRIKRTEIHYEGDSYNGLIMTVGASNELQKLIIEQVKPEFVGIITGNSDNVKNVANDLKEFAINKNIVCDEPHFYGELDVERIEKGFDDIIEWMVGKNIKRENIVIDLTGGKTPFSIAAFNSAKRNGVNAVYTDSVYEDKRPVAGTQKSILLVKSIND